MLVSKEQHKTADHIEKPYGESLEVVKSLAAIFTIGTRSPHDELYLGCVESTLCLQALAVARMVIYLIRSDCARNRLAGFVFNF